jgi:hypothetical protein
MNIKNDNTKRYLDFRLRELVQKFKKDHGSSEVNCQIDKALSVFEEKLFPYMKTNNYCPQTNTCPTPTNSCPQTNTCPMSTNCCPPTNPCPTPTNCCPPTNTCPPDNNYKPCQDDDSIENVLRNISTDKIDFQTDSYSFGDWNNLIRKVMNNIEKENEKTEVPLIIYPKNNNNTTESGNLASKLEKCFGVEK